MNETGLSGGLDIFQTTTTVTLHVSLYSCIGWLIHRRAAIEGAMRIKDRFNLSGPTISSFSRG